MAKIDFSRKLFRITFDRPDMQHESYQQRFKTSEKTSEETVEKTVEKIIAAMMDDPKITVNKLKKITGLSRRGLEWNISKLKKKGKIRRVGPDKGGHWEVQK